MLWIQSSLNRHHERCPGIVGGAWGAAARWPLSAWRPGGRGCRRLAGWPATAGLRAGLGVACTPPRVLASPGPFRAHPLVAELRNVPWLGGFSDSLGERTRLVGPRMPPPLRRARAKAQVWVRGLSGGRARLGWLPAFGIGGLEHARSEAGVADAEGGGQPAGRSGGLETRGHCSFLAPATCCQAGRPAC